MIRRFAVPALLAVLAASAGAAGLPLQINIQGKLLDPSTGAPRSGSYSVTFNLYGVPTGGASLYTESQTITVSNGVFSTRLGQNATLSPDLFAGASQYLGITVPPDGEMTPRQLLVMSPYAFTSAQLVSAADIRVNAGTAYSTFTAAGNWQLPAGLVASTASFSGALTASSGTFTATGASQYSLAASSGALMSAGTLKLAAASAGLDATGTGLVASTGSFTATGASQYSLTTSSGISVLAGTVRIAGSGGLVADSTVAAADYFGSGADLSNPRPNVSSATLNTTVTMTANTETVILSTDITPSRTSSLIQIWGDVGLNRIVNNLSTWQIRVRRQVGGACTTGSTQVGITNNATVPNTNGYNMLVPVLKIDAPATTSQVEYCITATAPAAQSLDERTLTVMEVGP
ncbi:MAG: hypothetical protein KGM24_01480 [Elusimicrobia bacterium]|nr:hypothetical protein [Elusimicrobiota bacterium]